MNGHFLTKMTDMFHWICSAIIKGECGLMKSPRETRTFYISHKRGLSNLTQCLIHGVVPKAFRGWALILMPMVIFLGRVLDLRLYVASFVSSEDSSKSGDERLRRARCNSFFSSSISRCMSFSFFAWETWLFPHD